MHAFVNKIKEVIIFPKSRNQYGGIVVDQEIRFVIAIYIWRCLFDFGITF